MTRAFVGLGSNLGDRERYLRDGVEAMGGLPGTEVVRVSSLYDTEPVGGEPGEPRYLNAVAELETALPARQLLDGLLELEARAGRPRTGRAGPRVLDLDLLFYDREILEEVGLSVPHPRYAERSFVLVPLVELAPDWTDPRTGFRMDTLLKERTRPGAVRRAGRLEP